MEPQENKQEHHKKINKTEALRGPRNFIRFLGIFYFKEADMDKDLANKIIEKHNGRCVICGSSQIELHHIIFGRGLRRRCENEYSIVPLCYYHHRGTVGVHGRDGRELDLYLKRKLREKYFDMGYTEDEVRKMMGGRLYLEKGQSKK